LLSGSAIGVVTVLFGFASGAMAQDRPAADPEATEVEELVVTGSRIPRPNLEQSAPVSTVSTEVIRDAGTVNLGDIIAELPSMSASDTVRGNADSGGEGAGLNFPNLRNLGAARTLTLVNGKRHVGGDAGSGAVDLSSIPSPLVERVEVVTGGASAIYGSDAVSGVVNIILRDDFEGVEFNAQYGIAENDIGEYYSFDLTVGGTFEDGRGNVTLSYLSDHTDQVTARDIPELQDFGSVINPENTGPNDGIFNVFIVPFVGSEFIDENGVLFNGFTGEAYGFDAAGNLVAQPARTATNSFAFGQLEGGYCETCFYTEDWVNIIPNTDRETLAATGRFDFTPNIRGYVDAKYVRSTLQDFFQPSFSFFEQILQPDNAFITPEIQAALGPEIAAGGVYISRFLADIGGAGRSTDLTRETFRVVTGLEGNFDTAIADFGWELSYNYGRTENEFRGAGTVIPGNYNNALDSILVGGEAVCRSTVDPTALPAGTTGEPCVAYNPFGQQNTAAALDYVSHDSVRTHQITQEVVQGVFGFDTSKFFNLPGGAIGFAGGFEVREETSANNNDPFVKTGLSENAPQPDASGGFDVTEYFIEVNVPLLADMPFFHRLSAGAAFRTADYSHIGEADAYKFDLLWAPVRDVTFRATMSEAVRAPNITEAFLPITSTFFNISDPCDKDVIGNDPDRAANCALDPDVPPQPFESSTNASIRGTIAGNPNLDPEEAETFTYGVVFQPRWVDGLAISLDYYDITIENAIASVAAQTIINNCYDTPGGLTTQFCDLFDRDPADGGNIRFLRQSVVNIARLETSGIDVNVLYSLEVPGIALFGDAANASPGRLGFSMNANWLDKFDTYADQSRPNIVNNNKGEIGNPEWSYVARVSYNQGPATLSWELRYEDEVTFYETTPAAGVNRPEARSPNKVQEIFYNDFVARYELDSSIFGSNGVELYAGVNNVFDERLPYSVGFGSGQYDILGRRFFGGLRLSF